MEPFVARRDALKLLGGAALAAKLQLAAGEPGAPLYFSREEFTLLDKLTDILIPTDSQSPGAHAARVAVFIDRTVAEAFLPEEKTSWRKGLAALNAESQSAYQQPFLKLNSNQQVDLLKKLAAKEHDPETEAESFFTQLKQTTVFAYYTSEIGIHTDMQYMGNVIQEQFSGYEAT